VLEAEELESQLVQVAVPGCLLGLVGGLMRSELMCVDTLMQSSH